MKHGRVFVKPCHFLRHGIDHTHAIEVLWGPFIYYVITLIGGGEVRKGDFPLFLVINSCLGKGGG